MFWIVNCIRPSLLQFDFGQAQTLNWQDSFFFLANYEGNAAVTVTIVFQVGYQQVNFKYFSTSSTIGWQADLLKIPIAKSFFGISANIRQLHAF